MNLSEKEIIQKIKNGEIDYYSLIVKKYSFLIYQYVKKKIKNINDVEDIVQNIFIAFYKAIDRFNEEKSIKPYLFQIVANELKMFYRKNQKLLPLKEGIIFEKNEENNFFDEKILDRLNNQEKKILLMIIDGYSYQEIAKKFKKSLNTIKSIIRRARIKIKKYEKI